MAEVLIDNIDDFKKGTYTEVKVKDGGATVSTAVSRIIPTSFSGRDLPALIIGAVSTPPEFRRMGYVREMFEKMHNKGAENGAAVALIHTFSFAFYRKFGYEKVGNHLIIETPSAKLDFVPYENRFIPCGPDKAADMISIYDTFRKGRNLLVRRNGYGDFAGEKKYICYIGGVPSAYIGFDTAARFEINRLVDTKLTVREFAFVSKEALLAIFSFLRMFEGEFEKIEFANCAPAPEIDMVLRHYNHTTYRIAADIEARPLNTVMILDANAYPRQPGRFTLKINDTLPEVGGVFDVSYGLGGCTIRKADSEPDVELTPGAFIRIVYGLDDSAPEYAAYMEGVNVINERGAADFFRAFPKRPGGVFEHF